MRARATRSCATAIAGSSVNGRRASITARGEATLRRAARDRARRVLGRVRRVRRGPRDRAHRSAHRRRPRAPRPRVRRASTTCVTVDELPHDQWSARAEARHSVELGRGTSSLTADEHAARVARVHELLAAGECYQVNLTRRLTFDVAPEPIALFSAADAREPRARTRRCARSATRCPAWRSCRPRRSCSCASTAARSRRGRSRARPPTQPTLRVEREGPRRERDDRRPRAQRSRPRVRIRFDQRSRPVRDRAPHPGLAHLVSTVRGRLRADVEARRRSCAPRSRPRR